MTRSAILSLLLAACTPAQSSPGCPAGSFPYWLTDGDRCVFVGIAPAPSIADSRAEPSIRYYQLAYVPVELEYALLPLGELTFASDDTVVLNGPRIHSRITAPNTYRDPDGRCYSSNVLHVSGERIAVECP